MSSTAIIETIKQTLTELIDKLDVSYSKIEVVEEENGVFRANIETDRAPFLIGMYGERIDAIQHLLKSILWKKALTENVFVIVDIDDYRKSREDRIVAIAEEKVEAVRATGIPQTMPFLEPYLRKIIHTHISSGRFQGVTTQSVGEGRDRRLQIVAETQAAPDSRVEFA